MRFIPRARGGAGFLILLLCCTSCAKYRPQPLDPDQVLDRLKTVSLSDLMAERGVNACPQFGPLDLTRGLGPDEVVLAALFLNPELKAKHLEKGLADGQLITAGLWPNPTFDNKTLPASAPHTGAQSIEASLSFEVLRWGERAGQRQARAAEVQAVQMEILAEEWRVAMDARSAWWDLVALREQTRVNAEAEEVSSKILTGVKDRLQKGAASAMEFNQSELIHAQREAATLKLNAETATAGRALRKILGLPPQAELPLYVPPHPLARLPRPWNYAQLEGSLTTSAPMHAAQWRYAVSEGELRAAVARQYPGLQLGPSGTFEFDGHAWSSLLGFVATFEIPFLNRNQGEIREKKAARDVARAEYVARLHAARADLAEAAAEVEAIEQQLEFQERQILPKAEKSLELLNRVIASGEVEAYALLQAQTAFLETKQRYLDSLVEHRKALLSVERALGRRLEDVQPAKTPEPASATTPAPAAEARP